MYGLRKFYVLKGNAAMLLDFGHTLRGEHIREEWG
jgi:hypothetical protein